MADKSFGVKELNLLNASGTPTVTSPNNLNLNANTVAISTSCTIGNNLTITSTTTSANVNVTGIATVVNFNATGISTIAQPSNTNAHSAWLVTANGTSAYRFTGPGQDGSDDDPDVYLVRGQRYIFTNNSGGSHPFQIRTSAGADGAAYSTGVTNNGASSGNIDFAPTYDSPAQLVYQCTSHSGMVGNIYLRDAAGGNTNVGVTTFSGSVIVADTSAFTADTGADDLIVGSTNSGINRGITILNHTGQDGRLCFGQSGDPDAGMIKYSHGSDVMQFFVESSEKLRITATGVNIPSSTNTSYNKGFTPSILTINNNSADNTVDFSQGIVFTDNANNQGDGGWVHAAICTVGTTGYNGNIIFGVDGNGSANNNLSGITEQLRIANDGFVSFGGDADLGFIRSGTNTLQCKTNGTLCTEFAANQRVRMPQVYSTNGSNMRDVQIESDGTLCAGNTSIRLSKKNITSQSDISWLYNLNPVTFNYRKKIVDKVTGEHTYLEEVEEETSYGLIAEEVETIKKDFCFYNNNKLAGVHYNQLITPLLKSLQDQKKEIDILKAEVAALKAK